MSGSGLETLPDVRGWSQSPPRYLGVAGSPSRMVERPSRMSGRCREAVPDDRKWSGGHP